MNTMLAFVLGSLTTVAVWAITSVFARRIATMQGRGGAQFEIDGQVYLFERHELDEMVELMPLQSAQRIRTLQRRVLRGELLTPAEIAEAQHVWRDAARLWLQAHPDKITD
jgi:hypothetical protein